MSHVDTGSFGGGKPGRQNPDFELNLASIIDCFVVLIAFLLISSSYLAIGMLDAGVQAGQVAPSTDSAPPPVQVTIEILEGGRVQLKLKGKSNETSVIAATQNGAWDWAELSHRLEGVRKTWPGVDGVTLTASKDIEYKNVVEGMESIRKTIPMVLLGEF